MIVTEVTFLDSLRPLLASATLLGGLGFDLGLGCARLHILAALPQLLHRSLVDGPLLRVGVEGLKKLIQRPVPEDAVLHGRCFPRFWNLPAAA